MLQGTYPKEMLIISKGVCDLIYIRADSQLKYEKKRLHVDNLLQDFKTGRGPIYRNAEELKRKTERSKFSADKTTSKSIDDSFKKSFKSKRLFAGDKLDASLLEARNDDEQGEENHNYYLIRKIGVGDPVGMRALLIPSYKTASECVGHILR